MTGFPGNQLVVVKLASTLPNSGYSARSCRYKGVGPQHKDMWTVATEGISTVASYKRLAPLGPQLVVKLWKAPKMLRAEQAAQPSGSQD